MRVLVTGRDGQLGRAMAERVADIPVSELEFLFVGRDQLDLMRPNRFTAALDEAAADVVINAAAYTKVDQAEDELDLAMAVNAAGPGKLAEQVARRGARFVQISTDYVFGGDKLTPYYELDPIDPQSAYGQSKAAGEMRVREAGNQNVIVRTAWIYSPFGANFVKTMLRLASERDEVRVVDDQYGNPTSAHDLADGLIAMCRYWRRTPDMGAGWTFHLGAGGEATWADVAREVFEISASLGGPTAYVISIPTSEYPTKARRPVNSRLDSELFRETFGYRAPDWRQSLRGVVDRLVRDGGL